MTPIQATVACLRKSVNFLDRASRAEFWRFAPLWLASAFLVADIVLPQPMSKGAVMFNFVARAVLCLPAIAAAARRAVDAGIDHLWVGNGFAAIFFGISLFEVARTAPPEAQVGWMYPAGITMIVGALLILAFVLSRPSKSAANMHEVRK